MSNVALHVGISNAEDAMAVSSAQLRAQKLMQDFAVFGSSRAPAMPPGVSMPGLLGPSGGQAASGPAGAVGVLPVMLPNPDDSGVAAYQVQPICPAGSAPGGAPVEISG